MKHKPRAICPACDREVAIAVVDIRGDRYTTWHRCVGGNRLRYNIDTGKSYHEPVLISSMKARRGK